MVGLTTASAPTPAPILPDQLLATPDGWTVRLAPTFASTVRAFPGILHDGLPKLKSSRHGEIVPSLEGRKVRYAPYSRCCGQYGSNLTASGLVKSFSQTCRNRSSRRELRAEALRISLPEGSTMRPAVTAKPQKVTSIPSLFRGDGRMRVPPLGLLRLFLMDVSTFSSRSESTNNLQ
jgi:hypothetical protein